MLLAGSCFAAGEGIARSVPPQGAKRHTLVPGERYQANAFRRWFWGTNYRQLWQLPIEVDVLDFDLKEVVVR